MPTAATTHAKAPHAAPKPARRNLRYLSLSHLPEGIFDGGVRGMEAALRRLAVPHRPSPRIAAFDAVQRLLAKLHLVRPLLRFGKTVYFVPNGGYAEGRFVPVTYFNEVIPWIFDAWPNVFDRIAKVLRRQRVRLAFFTARQSADYFRKTLGIDAQWLPEACDPTDFDPSHPLAQRTTDVLELGRRHDPFHDAITPALAKHGRPHLYEKAKGQIIFPTTHGLRKGYANSKISVCFPSSTTHPQRAGHVETVTLRYFESMAAKCLLLGQCPAELKDLFGYDPVIPADPKDPAAQIEHILSHITQYQPAVERNHQRLLEVGTYDVRARELLKTLAAHGIRP
jgi:hypothetical protein